MKIRGITPSGRRGKPHDLGPIVLFSRSLSASDNRIVTEVQFMAGEKYIVLSADEVQRLWDFYNKPVPVSGTWT